MSSSIDRLSSEAACDTWLAAEDGLALLFKHSTRCPVSTAAHAELVAYAGEAIARGVRIGVVYVVEDRALSNALAARFGVRHESPQALFVSEGEVAWHASHGAITREALAGAEQEIC